MLIIIKYFPKPYPDEILYSVIARFQKHFGSEGTEVIRSLWGNVKSKSISYQVNQLQSLLDNTLLGQCYSARQLAFQHTLLPFYSAFCGREIQKQQLENMVQNITNYFLLFVGRRVSKVGEKDNYQFCPECVKSDIKSYGEPYWHRIHQVPGVLICPIHKTELRETCPVCSIPFLQNRTQYACLSDRCTNGHDVTEVKASIFTEKTLRHLTSYTNEVCKLFTTDFCYEPELISKRYIVKLHELNLIGLKGQLKEAINFSTSFIDYYGNELLDLLESRIEVTDQYNWLRRIVWQTGYKHLSHPLRHLLLIKYLFGSLENFNIANTEYFPFGKGPWPCLNPAASHYRMSIIKDCHIYRGVKKTYGNFSCECGYKYSRGGPDKSDEDRYRADNIITYGQVWEDKLENLVDSKKMSMKEIGLKLGVGEKTAIKYNNKRKIKKNQKVTSRTKVELYLKDYRNTIEEIIKKNPNISRRQILQITEKEYRWLKKHDKEWLMNILPKSKRIVQPYLKSYRRNLLKTIQKNPNASRTDIITLASQEYYWLKLNDREWLMNALPSPKVVVRSIDWNVRDQEYANSIKIVVEDFLKIGGKPKRITLTSIYEKLPRIGAILKNPSYKTILPETKKCLRQYSETIDEYRIRCVKWAATELISSGQNLTEAAIKKYLKFEKLSMPVKCYIQGIITEDLR